VFKIVQGLGYLFWLKVASFAITSVFGIIAVLHDFKAKGDNQEKGAGHLNFWGKLTLAGLGVAALIGAVSQVAETTQQGRVAHATIVIGKSGGCPLQAPLGRAR